MGSKVFSYAEGYIANTGARLKDSAILIRRDIRGIIEGRYLTGTEVEDPLPAYPKI